MLYRVNNSGSSAFKAAIKDLKKVIASRFNQYFNNQQGLCMNFADDFIGKKAA